MTPALSISMIQDISSFADHSPTSPDSMHVHTLGNINYKLDVCIVVVVRASRYLDTSEYAHGFESAGFLSYLNVLISHPNIICVCS